MGSVFGEKKSKFKCEKEFKRSKLIDLSIDRWPTFKSSMDPHIKLLTATVNSQGIVS